MQQVINGVQVDIVEVRPENRFKQVLDVATQVKAETRPWTRTSLAEEFFRENPMPWLLDSDPVDEPEKDQRRSA